MTNTPLVRRLSKFVRSLIHRTHGQDLVEYAMLAGIATSIIVLTLGSISTRAVNYYGAAVTSIAERTAAAGTMPVGNGGGGGGNNGGGNGGGGNGNGH